MYTSFASGLSLASPLRAALVESLAHSKLGRSGACLLQPQAQCGSFSFTCEALAIARFPNILTCPCRGLTLVFQCWSPCDMSSAAASELQTTLCPPCSPRT